MLLFLYVSGDFGVVEHGVDGGDCGDAQGDCLECQYAPAEVSGRVEFLDRAKGLDVPRQVTGPVDHRDQGPDGDTDQAEFQDEGDCGHEVKDGFDNRTRWGICKVLHIIIHFLFKS